MKIKRKLLFLLVTVFSVGIISSSGVFATTNSNMKQDLNNSKTHKYEAIYSVKPMLSKIKENKNNAVPDYITGEYELNGETIVFGIKNNFFQNYDEFEKYIMNSVANTVREFSNSNSIENRELPTIRIQRELFYGDEKKLTDIKKDFDAKANMVKRSEVVNVIEQKDMLKKVQKDNSVNGFTPADESIPLNELKILDKIQETSKDVSSSKLEELDKKDVIEEREVITGLSSSSEQGGPSYPDIIGNISYWDVTPPANPYKGDKQDRAKLKERFNDDQDTNVYCWYPSYVNAKTYPKKHDSSTYNAAAVYLGFKWESERLRNLNVDDNEAVEAEVLFYNYGPDSTIPGDGSGWMQDSPDYWYTNLPSGYLDTRFLDEDGLKSYAVGTKDTGSLQADKLYYARFYDDGIRRNTSRLWEVNFQRGYYYDYNNLWYKTRAGSGDEWFVFNEEYESSIKVKNFHKYNLTYYAPEFPSSNSSISSTMNTEYTEYTTDDFTKMFRYMDTYNKVRSNDVTSSMKTYISDIKSSGHYNMYRFQVNNSGTYIMYTSKYGLSSADTVIELYDHNYNLVKLNDDADDTRYSRITRYLSKGDYYLIVKPYSKLLEIKTKVNFVSGSTIIP